jgi:hypothetical protein
MTAQEFDEQMLKIREVFNQSQKKLEIIYLNSLINFKIGDVIKLNDTIIEVTGYTYFYGLYEVRPDVVYKGKILTKKLTPNKKEVGSIGKIYGNSNVVLLKKSGEQQ